ncbi:MAG: MltA domain-containing protein [Deltaproteobacteria bacterium]|nr:MltA domain-containing protein [Deltaproteobacteria bacterium]
MFCRNIFSAMIIHPAKFGLSFTIPRLLSGKFRVLLSVVTIISFLWSCAGIIERPVVMPPPLVTIEARDFPPLEDDLDRASLETAIERSLEYYGRLPEDKLYRFGDNVYTIGEMKESLLQFREILAMPLPDEMKRDRIKEAFTLYRATGKTGSGDVLFTGYYAPILEGSVEKTSVYRYPLYRTPDDHVVINLGRFKSAYEGKRLIARVVDGQAIPYYTRKEIDRDASLSERGLEMVWLADPVDVFFLHIQGSGIIHLRDGSYLNVSYEQSNGHSYRSVGRLLMDEKKLSIGEVSMRGIKQYLMDHPEEMFDILAHNESYVFFRVVESGPVGSLNVHVTGGRTIATDTHLFPRGALAFVKVKKPVIDEDGKITSWIPFSRFVLNQDTGGAIKGPGRVDLYCGEGNYAEIMAGHMKEEGDLYFLVTKKAKNR